MKSRTGLPESKIERIFIWSARLRWTHAFMGISVLLLFFTAWLVNLDIALSEVARGYHYLLGIVFTASLIYRVYLLLFGTKSERVEDSMPVKNYTELAKSHLRFYFSLGKSRLPDWYAHNPFWGPIYLVFFAISTIMIITGFAIGKLYFGTSFSLSGIHSFGAVVILLFSVLHIAAAILHDVKAKSTGLSAILSGNKYFTIRPTEKQAPKEFPITFSVSSPGNKKISNIK